MTNDEESSDEEFRITGEPAREETPIDYGFVEVRHRSRFFMAVLLALAAPFLIDGLAFALLEDTHSDFWTTIFVAVMLAKFGLLCMWLAWGGSRVIWRMLVVMVSLWLTKLVTPFPSEELLYFLLLFSQALICAGIIAVPKILGVRWVADWSDQNRKELRTSNRYQFSIFDILMWTTMMAVIAGLIGAAKIPKDGLNFHGEFVAYSIASCILAVFALLAMWAELIVSNAIIQRVALNYLFALLVTVAVCGILRAPGEAVGHILSILAITVSCMLGFLYALRRWDHRLVQKKCSVPFPPIAFLNNSESADRQSP